MTQLFVDTECYKDYWLIMFMAAGGKSKSFDMYPGKKLDYDGVWRFLLDKESEIVTFNGNKYDMLMIALALSGADCATLKRASDAIIVGGMMPWDFEKAFGVTRLTDVNHIDLIEIAPGMVSLKIYGGRLHLPRLQDLPFEHDASIREEDRLPLRTYCRNDLVVTCGLYYNLLPAINLRRTMSADMGVDLRSKSDAQIAETVITHVVNKDYGVMPRKVPLTYTKFTYDPPEYIGFASENLQKLLETVRTAPMVIKESGHVEMPPTIDNFPIEIAGKPYTVGIGGLHSKEAEATHRADDTTLLRDIDVVSYYPTLILNMGMYPEAVGPRFLDAYQSIRDERVTAKRAKDKVKDAVLKITLNGTFGKTSSKYSIFYNPKMMIATTLTGQLSLLMLIEAMEAYGIPVVSANTDGIVVKFPVDKEPLQRKIVAAWEKRTHLDTEETNYRAIHARDVNSYIAIKTDGSIKAKGFFAPSGIAKSPQNEICSEAVIKYLADGTPIERTVQSCRDIRKFLTLRTVNGGAEKEGYTLGKAIRWYYAVGEFGVITYRTNGNTVPRSERAKPLMDLPTEFPHDVDYEWYIAECNSMLMDVGVVPRPPKVKLPRKNSKAWKQMVAEGLITA